MKEPSRVSQRCERDRRRKLAEIDFQTRGYEVYRWISVHFRENDCKICFRAVVVFLHVFGLLFLGLVQQRRGLQLRGQQTTS